MKHPEIGNGILPNVYFSKIEVAESDTQYILDVTFTMKDFAIPGEQTWLGSDVFSQSNINLLTVMTHPDLDIDSGQIISDLNSGGAMPIDVPDSEPVVFSNSISCFLTGEEQYLLEQHTDIDGVVLHDAYFGPHRIEISKSDFDGDLYLYACVTLDLLQLTSNYGVSGDLSFLGNSTISGPVTSEQIFRNNELIRTTNYFVREDNGLVWPGPVHFHSEDGYMGGSFHTDEPHPKLLMKSTLNIKIVDLVTET